MITTTALVTEIHDPKLRVVARNLRAMLQLTVARVAAHHSAPAAIALPTTGLEAILAQRFAALPADRQRRSAERATALLAGADRSVRFGPAGAASLRSKLPIADQVRERLAPRELGLTAAYLDGVQAVADQPGFRPLATLDHLEVRLHQVRCVDETDPEFASRDFIIMGGTAINGAGATTKVDQLTVGTGFDDGTTKRFDPPRRITSWNVTEGSAWPKTFFFTMVLAEKDNGGFPKFLDTLFEGLKKEVVSLLATAIGTGIGLVGGALGAAIGALLGWAIGELYGMFKDWWEDDEFPPQTVSCTHSGLGGRFAGGATDSAESVLTFKGHGGTYKVTFDWRLFA